MEQILVFITIKKYSNMRKLLLFSITIVLLLCNSCVRRTPEYLLKLQFGIDISSFDYKIESFDDQWHTPHGEGHCHIVYTINNISKKNIDAVVNAGAKEFPISDTIRRYHRMRREICGDNHQGYYIFQENEDNPDEFKYFVFDITDSKAILYYQIP